MAAALSVAASSAAAASDSTALAPALAAFRRRDFATAIKLAEPLAAKDDADAQMLLGMAYFVGPEGGLKSDFNKAGEWFWRASLLKDKEAAYGYALLTQVSMDVNDKERAKETLAAAEMGSPGAMESIGEYLMTGLGIYIPQDDGQAMQWLTAAGRKGSLKAALFLGRCYMSGRLGSRPDPLEAYKWLWIAANAPVVDPIQEPLAPSYWWRKKDATDARFYLAEVGAKMTKEQIAEARRRAAAVGRAAPPAHPKPRPS